LSAVVWTADGAPKAQRANELRVADNHSGRTSVSDVVGTATMDEILYPPAQALFMSLLSALTRKVNLFLSVSTTEPALAWLLATFERKKNASLFLAADERLSGSVGAPQNSIVGYATLMMEAPTAGLAAISRRAWIIIGITTMVVICTTTAALLYVYLPGAAPAPSKNKTGMDVQLKRDGKNKIAVHVQLERYMSSGAALKHVSTPAMVAAGVAAIGLARGAIRLLRERSASPLTEGSTKSVGFMPTTNPEGTKRTVHDVLTGRQRTTVIGQQERMEKKADPNNPLAQDETVTRWNTKASDRQEATRHRKEAVRGPGQSSASNA
ncbi:hypothetical protein PBRA_000044, partial [Plasmodiophora brassicae]